MWVGARSRRRRRARCSPRIRRATCVLCDDGLQHYALARDVEIAVVDAARGVGNGLLLPAGPLREPEARLRRVDAVVRLVSGDVPREPHGDGRSTFMTHEPLPWRNVRDPQRERRRPALGAGAGVHAVAGIGNPQRFFALLRAQGIAPVEHPFRRPPRVHAQATSTFPAPPRS